METRTGFSYRAGWRVAGVPPSHHHLHCLPRLLQEGQRLLLADARLQRDAIYHQDLVPLLEAPVPAAQTHSQELSTT